MIYFFKSKNLTIESAENLYRTLTTHLMESQSTCHSLPWLPLMFALVVGKYVEYFHRRRHHKYKHTHMANRQEELFSHV